MNVSGVNSPCERNTIKFRTMHAYERVVKRGKEEVMFTQNDKSLHVKRTTEREIVGGYYSALQGLSLLGVIGAGYAVESSERN